MLRKLANAILAQKQNERRSELFNKLLRHEAKIGGQLFGPVPKGVRREFFCLDRHTWVWHEEWTDEKGDRKTKTTSYNIRPGQGILKAQDGQNYQYVGLEEAKNLAAAAQLYKQRIKQELYSFL